MGKDPKHTDRRMVQNLDGASDYFWSRSYYMRQYDVSSPVFFSLSRSVRGGVYGGIVQIFPIIKV